MTKEMPILNKKGMDDIYEQIPTQVSHKTVACSHDIFKSRANEKRRPSPRASTRSQEQPGIPVPSIGASIIGCHGIVVVRENIYN